jgi:hypothetical protein
MDVTYFRPPRPGPELQLQIAVTKKIPSLFPSRDGLNWMAGHVSIGAGMPDLLVISSDPEVVALSRVDFPHAHILAYLRAVGCARLDTIVQRVRWSPKMIARCLDALIEAKAVNNGNGTFSLCPRWRNILAEIISIEVKMEDWRRAIEQAGRNSIFAHRSYIALPTAVASRIKSEPILRQIGVGVLAVDDSGEVLMVRRTPRRQPLVWPYYYELASLTARHFGSYLDAIRRAH